MEVSFLRYRTGRLIIRRSERSPPVTSYTVERMDFDPHRLWLVTLLTQTRRFLVGGKAFLIEIKFCELLIVECAVGMLGAWVGAWQVGWHVMIVGDLCACEYVWEGDDVGRWRSVILEGTVNVEKIE
jgi:hypothetical protein